MHSSMHSPISMLEHNTLQPLLQTLDVQSLKPTHIANLLDSHPQCARLLHIIHRLTQTDLFTLLINGHITLPQFSSHIHYQLGLEASLVEQLAGMMISTQTAGASNALLVPQYDASYDHQQTNTHGIYAMALGSHCYESHISPPTMIDKNTLLSDWPFWAEVLNEQLLIRRSWHIPTKEQLAPLLPSTWHYPVWVATKKWFTDELEVWQPSTHNIAHLSTDKAAVFMAYERIEGVD